MTNPVRTVAALLSSILACATGALAQEKAQHPAETQVPGYYRASVGDFRVTALYDGSLNIATGILKNIAPTDIPAQLAKAFLVDRNGVPTAVNAFLVRNATHTILVDTGAGSCYGPALGRIVANLKAAGVSTDMVDTVLLTHLHGDHYCGLMENGRPTFPKATIYAAKAEAEYWLSDKTLADAPTDRKAYYQRIRDTLTPYKAQGRFRTFEPGAEILPGVHALSTVGHTPGHTSYRIESQGQTLLIWGDIVHSHAIQFAHPEVAIEYDSDPVQAVATRKALLAQVSAAGWVIAGAHLPFPGMGHVRAEGTGYAYVPLEYAPLP